MPRDTDDEVEDWLRQRAIRQGKYCLNCGRTEWLREVEFPTIKGEPYTSIYYCRWCTGWQTRRENQRIKAIDKKAVQVARRQLYENPHLANYVLRDLTIVEKLGYKDLCWTIHLSGSASPNDVLPIIEAIESYYFKGDKNVQTAV